MVAILSQSQYVNKYQAITWTYGDPVLRIDSNNLHKEFIFFRIIKHIKG